MVVFRLVQDSKEFLNLKDFIFTFIHKFSWSGGKSFGNILLSIWKNLIYKIKLKPPSLSKQINFETFKSLQTPILAFNSSWLFNYPSTLRHRKLSPKKRANERRTICKTTMSSEWSVVKCMNLVYHVKWVVGTNLLISKIFERTQKGVIVVKHLFWR